VGHGELNVNPLVVSAILSLTVTASVGVGIVAAYGAVIGVLNLFAAARQQQQQARTPAILVPSESHASGD
jgi:hypothetical protein